MKTSSKVWIAIFVLVILVGYGSKWWADRNAEWVPFAEMPQAELRESLLQRLDANRIEYQVETDGTVLLKKKDTTRAVVCCS